VTENKVKKIINEIILFNFNFFGKTENKFKIIVE